MQIFCIASQGMVYWYYRAIERRMSIKDINKDMRPTSLNPFISKVAENLYTEKAN